MDENILGYKLSSFSADNIAEYVCANITARSANDNGTCTWLACMNPHSYVASLQDVEFSSALANATWLIPDGFGIILASKVLGGAIRQRVTGSDVFYALNERMNRLGNLSVFFLGASEACLEDIRSRMASDYPNIRFSGCYSPPYTEVYAAAEIERMISAINQARADVLWVGMTAPKQEKWLFQHAGRLNVKFAAAIGAVFDFYTGRVKRSHPIFQKLGLEWLPRLLQEPRRLWKRNFVSTPVFLFRLFRFKFFRR